MGRDLLDADVCWIFDGELALSAQYWAVTTPMWLHRAKMDSSQSDLARGVANHDEQENAFFI